MSTCDITKGLCDKCKQEVSLENDAVAFDCFLAFGAYMSSTSLIHGARHLLPEGDCPGSPSRAQYLPDMPKDDRYPYNPKYEEKYRNAFVKLVEFAENGGIK